MRNMVNGRVVPNFVTMTETGMRSWLAGSFELPSPAAANVSEATISFCSETSPRKVLLPGEPKQFPGTRCISEFLSKSPPVKKLFLSKRELSSNGDSSPSPPPVYDHLSLALPLLIPVNRLELSPEFEAEMVGSAKKSLKSS